MIESFLSNLKKAIIPKIEDPREQSYISIKIADELTINLMKYEKIFF